MKELQTLKFYWLKYEVSTIEELIKNSDGIDSFAFSYYFPKSHDESKPLQLVAYAHMVNKAHPDGVYSTNYDTLSVYNNNTEEIGGPVILSNNVMSLAQMQKLINNAEKPDFLVFIPNINQDRHVYYTIKGYKNNSTASNEPLSHNTILPGTPPGQTNPSPPAT